MSLKYLTTIRMIVVAVLMFGSNILSASIIDGKYGAAQVFDVQRSPAYPSADQNFTASNFKNPYSDTDGQYSIGSGEYIQFTMGNPCVDDEIGIILYNSDGTQKQVISTAGSVWGLANEGFLFVSSRGYGTFVSNAAGYSLGDSLTYVPPVAQVGCSALSAYNATSTVLGVGETASSGTNNPPVLSPIANQTMQEDDAALSIVLNATDDENDTITFSATSSNPSIATVAIVSNSVVVTPVTNANGSLSVEVNATAAGQSAIQSFNVDITAVNDAPTIDTLFNNISLNEDQGSTDYAVSVNDLEGSDLNLTVESNNSNLLTVTPNWTNLINQAKWSQPLHFKLTTVANAYGRAKITVHVNDGVLNSSKVFEVNVSAVNDAPTLSAISDRIYFKNFSPKDINLSAIDVDDTNLTYSANVQTQNIVGGVSVSGNVMRITSLSGAYGDTNITVSVTDGNLTNSKQFNVQVLSIEAGDAQEEPSPTEVTENNGTKTYLNQISSDVNITRTEENNGSVSHKVAVGGKKVEAFSNVQGSKVNITPTGVQTTYKNTKVNVEVNASILGIMTCSIKNDNNVTSGLKSEVIGAKTSIEKDSNGSIVVNTTVQTNDENVSVVEYGDATAQHRVYSKDYNTTVTSYIEGVQTLISASGVKTSVDSNPLGGIHVRAVAVTDSNGTTSTSFQSIDSNGTILNTANTFIPTTPYSAGNRVKIMDIGGSMYIETKTASGSSRLTVE